jgi:hypothetical protein
MEQNIFSEDYFKTVAISSIIDHILVTYFLNAEYYKTTGKSVLCIESNIDKLKKIFLLKTPSSQLPMFI